MTKATTGPLVRILTALILALSLVGATAFSVAAAPGTASEAQPVSFQDDASDDDATDDDDGLLELLVEDEDGNPRDGAVFEILELDDDGTDATPVTDGDDGTDDDATDDGTDDGTDDATDDGTDDGDDATRITSSASSGSTASESPVRYFARAPGPEPVEDDGSRLVYELDAGTYLVTMTVAPDGCDLADPLTTDVNDNETTTETVVVSCASFAGDGTGDDDGADDGDGADDDGVGASGDDDGDGAVSSLPSTGQGGNGGASSSAILLLFGAISLVALTAAYAWRQQRTS